MLILRLLAILVTLGIVAGVAAYWVTGERRYLRLSWMLLRFGVAAGVLLVLFLFAERLLVMPF